MDRELELVLAKALAGVPAAQREKIEDIFADRGFLDRQRRPLSFAEWMELSSDHKYWQVDRTKIVGGVEISTIWVGTAMGIAFPARIFETAILGMPVGSVDEVARYHTEAEARAGHAALVRKLRHAQRYQRAYARRRR